MTIPIRMSLRQSITLNFLLHFCDTYFKFSLQDQKGSLICIIEGKETVFIECLNIEKNLTSDQQKCVMNLIKKFVQSTYINGKILNK